MRSIVIHMGATRHTITVTEGGKTEVFDINAMDKHQRGRFFAAFRDVLESLYGK